jgi:putative ABC transport system permease protein
MDTLLQDVRYGMRLLLKHRGFAAAAIVTLGLGIGANTAVFSVASGVLLRPLPYPEAERLVWGWGRAGENPRASVSPPDFVDFRAASRSFETLAAMSAYTIHPALAGGERPQQLSGVLVSAGFFEALGVRPLIGRAFGPADEAVSLPESVMLSHRLWRERFSGDASLAGRAITIDGRAMTVIGVMPAGFRMPDDADVWLPLPLGNESMQVRRFHQLRLVARLRPGVSLAAAQAEMSALAAGLAARYPDSNTDFGVVVVSLRDAIVGDSRPALFTLLAAVAAVLLIACVNVANLLLARAAARRREGAIRSALGASRGRLVRQWLVESLLLSLAGGALGLLLGYWGQDLLRAVGPADFPRLHEVEVDGRVLLFTIAVSVATGIAFGLVPARQAARVDAQATLREGGARAAGGRGRVRAFLAAVEVMASVVLLAGAGLLARSLVRLLDVDPGFRAAEVVTTTLRLPAGKDEDEQRAFFQALLERVQGLPGVESAGLISELPLSGQRNDTYFTIEGRPASPSGQPFDANYRSVSDDYFRAMGIPLRQGRTFARQDGPSAPGVVIVNEPFVRAFFPNEDPLGRRIVVDLGSPFAAEIVGVVGGVRHSSLATAPDPEMYLSATQQPMGFMNLVVRARGDAAAPTLASGLRASVAAIDPDQPLGAVRTMASLVAASAGDRRFPALLLGGFAALALVLAAIGLYGVMSESVAQRTAEMGIRMALGASARDVVGLVIREGLAVTLAGLGAGIAGALALSRLLASLLYAVPAHDPVTFTGVAAVVAAMALAACALPARRAARTSPQIALRHE